MTPQHKYAGTHLGFLVRDEGPDPSQEGGGQGIWLGLQARCVEPRRIEVDREGKDPGRSLAVREDECDEEGEGALMAP